MGTATKTLVAAAVLGAVGLYFYGIGQDPAPIESTVATTDDGATATAAAGKAQTEGQASVREAALPREVAPSWLDHPYTLELDVLVVDLLGLPIRGQALRLGPSDCPLNRANVKTGEDGHVHLSWRSRVPSSEIILADAGETMRRVPLEHGRTASLTLVRKPATDIRTLFGTSASGTFTFTITGGSSIGPDLVLRSSARTPAMHEGLHPHAVFTTSPGARSRPATRTAFATSVVTLDGSSFNFKINGDEATPTEEPVHARIAGTVFGEDGKPAAKVQVALLGAGTKPVSRVQTDDDGQFVFEDLQPAEFVVRAGGDDQGLATCPAITTTGTTPVTLQLSRGTTVRGRAESRDGNPLAKARVTWQAADASWSDATETGENGTFTLANLPATPGTVMLWDPKQRRSFPIGFAKEVLADTADLLLREAPTSELQVDPVLPDGIAGRVTVRIWDLDTGVGTTMPRPKDGEPWRMERLRAGWYQVELSHPATGTVDAGRHWVDGKADCDIGRVAMPQPATAILAFDGRPVDPERVVELYRVRSDLDVHVAVPTDAIGEEQLLEPGDYALFWVDKAENVQFERFTAEAGKQVTVRIPH